MKHLRFLAAALFLLSSSLVAAPRIAVLLKDRDVFWSAAERGVVAAGKVAGVELLVKAPLVPNSLSQQLAMLAALAKEPIEVLVIAPLTTDDFKAPLAALAARGIKIVSLDTRLPQGVAAAHVGYNQMLMAEEAGKFFAELVPDGEKAAMLRANSIEGMSLREKTLISTFKSLRGQATFYSDVVAGSERQDDYKQSILLLETHPNIKAVCTPFTAGTMAMTRAIQAKGLSGKILHVGFGSGLPDSIVEAIDRGAMHGWVAQRPYLIGSKGVETAVDLLAGKTVPSNIEVPYSIVTKANLQDPQTQALRD